MPAQLLWIFAVTNFVVLPFTLFNLLLLNTSILEGVKPFVVVSGSMEPVIPTGSLIYASKKPRYDTGDVVTFALNNEFITHRIIKKVVIGKETYFSTKGDANMLEDGDLVHESHISGKITTVLPFIGEILSFYKQPFGLVVVAFLPVGILSAFNFRQAKKILAILKL